jgi:hypothetical protein
VIRTTDLTAFREYEYCLERSWNPHQSPTFEFATSVTVDTGGEFISRRIDEPIRRMIGGIQDPSCCL